MAADKWPLWKTVMFWLFLPFYLIIIAQLVWLLVSAPFKVHDNGGINCLTYVPYEGCIGGD